MASNVDRQSASENHQPAIRLFDPYSHAAISSLHSTTFVSPRRTIKPTIQTSIWQASIVQSGRGELAVEQAHRTRFLHANVDAGWISVVGAEKGDEETRGVRDGDIGGRETECFGRGGGGDGLGLGLVDVEALGWSGADVVVVIEG